LNHNQNQNQNQNDENTNKKKRNSLEITRHPKLLNNNNNNNNKTQIKKKHLERKYKQLQQRHQCMKDASKIILTTLQEQLRQSHLDKQKATEEAKRAKEIENHATSDFYDIMDEKQLRYEQLLRYLKGLFSNYSHALYTSEQERIHLLQERDKYMNNHHIHHNPDSDSESDSDSDNSNNNNNSDNNNNDSDNNNNNSDNNNNNSDKNQTINPLDPPFTFQFPKPRVHKWWDERYEALLRYHAIHGHLHVSEHQHRELYDFIFDLREKHRIGIHSLYFPQQLKLDLIRFFDHEYTHKHKQLYIEQFHTKLKKNKPS